MTRSVIWATILLLLVVACGDGEGGGPAEPATPVAPEAAADVELSMEAVRRPDDLLEVSLAIVNNRMADVAVSDPGTGSTDEPDSAAVRLVSMRDEVEPLPNGRIDAPPSSPGILVAAGQTLEFDRSLGLWPGELESVELCLEIVERAGMTGGGEMEHGGEVDLRGREPDVAPLLACTGPVELAE